MSIKSIFLVFGFGILVLLIGCKSDKWKAQTCSPITSSCSEMSYGPYKTLDECIEKMKTVGWGFNCSQDCDSSATPVCEKVMRYTVEQTNGTTRVIPNPSNP